MRGNPCSHFPKLSQKRKAHFNFTTDIFMNDMNDAQLLMCFGASQYRSFTGPKVRDKAVSWRDKNYWLWLFFSRLRFRAIASILTKYLRWCFIFTLLFLLLQLHFLHSGWTLLPLPPLFEYTCIQINIRLTHSVIRVKEHPVRILEFRLAENPFLLGKYIRKRTQRRYYDELSLNKIIIGELMKNK